jgi:hypothetical protein
MKAINEGRPRRWSQLAIAQHAHVRHDLSAGMRA